MFLMRPVKRLAEQQKKIQITDKRKFLINCLPFLIKWYIMENDMTLSFILLRSDSGVN